MKRIFTKVFSGTKMVMNGLPADEAAVQSWLAQEPIEVIGATGVCLCTAPNENDGFAWLKAELSQVGSIALDGSILTVLGGEGWNTVPQGIHAQNGHIAVTFPDGYSVPVKEEGYLYINLRYQGKSAGIAQFEYTFTVYYTKGRSK